MKDCDRTQSMKFKLDMMLKMFRKSGPHQKMLLNYHISDKGYGSFETVVNDLLDAVNTAAKEMKGMSGSSR